jgi:hypothetical protein
VKSAIGRILDEATGADQLTWLLRIRILVSAISAAAELKVADHVEQMGTDLAQLARATATHEESLYRLLRCLTAAGIFREISPRRYGHTDLSETLRSNSAGSMRSFAMMSTQEWFARPLDALVQSVRTGEGTFVSIFGEKPYEHVRRYPESARVLQNAMADFSRHYEGQLTKAYDFGRARHIVDVGGGNGAFLVDVLAGIPQAKGTVAELPEVCAQATEYLAARGMSSRCDVAAIDMFQSVPAGGDLYILKRCLHNWPDPQARRILENIRAALPAHGKILVIEGIIPAGPNALFNLLGDLQQLALGGARERTEAEMADLFESAGLKVTRSIRASESVGMVEGASA